MKKLPLKGDDSWLSWFFRGILFIGFLVLFGRLTELQIVKGTYFRTLANENRIRKIRITSPRGKILARGGEVLVGNIEVDKITEFNDGASEVTTQPLRAYRLKEAFAHVGGLLGEANEDEVGKINARCSQKGTWKLGSLIGRGGLEQEYDCILRGLDGEELVEVDTLGKRVRTLGRRLPVPGEDIKTNIDFGLQEKASQVMQGKTGAVVVTDGKGQVLALVSSPSYDPNKSITDALTDEALPLFNRAISGAYPPGSVFKIVTAAAALEEEKIDNEFTYIDTGSIKINEFTYNNWYFTQHGGVEGEIGLTRALARSTDTFFYKLGELLGADKLSHWANKFGLGIKTGIDIPGEVEGLIPNPQWKESIRGERWFLGNTYHMSIGQGDVLTTVLGVNIETSVIASNGLICTPKVFGDPNCKSINLKQDTINIIKAGMIDACSTGGTAFPFFDSSPRVACKTGTAETFEEDKTHAWLTVFGPVSKEDEPAQFPEIVLTLLYEKGGEGSRDAAPLAREIFDYYFETDANKKD